MTLREIIYMIMDELKIMSDDSTFNESHIKFLVNKYRITLLNQQYAKTNLPLKDSNYQSKEFTLDSHIELSPYGEYREFRKSKELVPTIINNSNTKVFIHSSDTNKDGSTINSKYLNYKVVMIPEERMSYVGFNKWMKNVVYSSIIDEYLYLYSINEQIEDINTVTIKAVFEDPNVSLDDEYPLEAGLVPLLIQSVVQELSPRTIQPEDSYNNASDDKANLTRYLASNTKSDLAKQLS